MLDSGMADIGFMCGLPYVMMHDKPQSSIELLLAPVMKSKKYNDEPKYYSYVIVHKDSKFDSFSDLKGSTFVYNDEISNSGYNVPRAKLIEMGETSGFFGKILRSGSHEESIRMVALGEAEVSAVDSLVYDYDVAKNPKFTQQTKILEILGPAGIPPVVISTRISPSLRKKISDILLGMKDDPVGAEILEEALVDRFTVVDDSNYDDVRKMRRQAQDSGFQVIR
jgi:phosphonate transport system substrate-binding protein